MALGFVTQVSGAVALAVDNIVNRWVQEVGAANAGTLKADQCAKDAVLSAEDIGAAWALALGLLFPPTNPVVQFSFSLTALPAAPVTAVQAIPPTVAGAGKCSDLGNGGSTISGATITANVAFTGNALSVTLNNLAGLVQGLYTGKVLNALGVKIADVQVNVTP
jgi:hypothetical protein